MAGQGGVAAPRAGAIPSSPIGLASHRAFRMALSFHSVRPSGLGSSDGFDHPIQPQRSKLM